MAVRLKLNKPVTEQKDIDYIFGAGLDLEAVSSEWFVSNAYGERLTEQQIRTLALRGYHVSPDEFSRSIERREIPQRDQLANLSREELERRYEQVSGYRGQIQQALIQLSSFGGFLDSVTLRIMQEGYRTADEMLERESFVYLDTIAFGGDGKSLHS